MSSRRMNSAATEGISGTSRGGREPSHGKHRHEAKAARRKRGCCSQSRRTIIAAMNKRIWLYGGRRGNAIVSANKKTAKVNANSCEFAKHLRCRQARKSAIRTKTQEITAEGDLPRPT